MPFKTLSVPVAVAGGGEFKWDGINIGGIAVTPDSSHVWISAPIISTVFRIRDPLGTPVVDIVLGHPNLTE